MDGGFLRYVYFTTIKNKKKFLMHTEIILEIDNFPQEMFLQLSKKQHFNQTNVIKYKNGIRDISLKWCYVNI